MDKPNTDAVAVCASFDGSPVFEATCIAVAACNCGQGPHPSLLLFDANGKHFATANIMTSWMLDMIQEMVASAGHTAKITVVGEPGTGAATGRKH